MEKTEFKNNLIELFAEYKKHLAEVSAEHKKKNKNAYDQPPSFEGFIEWLEASK